VNIVTTNLSTLKTPTNNQSIITSMIATTSPVVSSPPSQNNNSAFPNLQRLHQVREKNILYLSSLHGYLPRISSTTTVMNWG
jgi:hypothetical protein